MAQITLRSPADVGALIRDRRQARHLDEADLARIVGVSRFGSARSSTANLRASLALVLRTLETLGVRLSADVLTGTAAARADSAPVIAPDIDAVVAAARRQDRS